jgi:hypothetical protein
VVDFAAEKHFYAIYDPPGSRNDAHSVVSRVVPPGQLDPASLGIRKLEGTLLQQLISVSGLDENFGFLWVE